jgi:NAD(P)-dependent dehydrogenase (short-subunit alcohol dehydrogenase family)
MWHRPGGRAIRHDDRFALVTGTSSGIGAAVANRLLGEGWQVIGVARRAAPIGHPQYRHLKIDLSRLDGVVDAIEHTVAPMLAERSWSRVGLVNNAGLGGQLGPMERIDPRTLAEMHAVNVASPVCLMGAFVRNTPAHAALRIVNVSSGAAVRPLPGLAAYGACKAALRMAGMVLGAELDSPQRNTPAPADTAILSFEPGTVDTEMQTEARNLRADQFPWVQMYKDFKANGRLVTPDKPAAEIVAWLAADGHPRFSERRLGQP